jgi:hypothetical protein
VVSAIKSLAPAQQQTISEGLSLYANALLACRETAATRARRAHDSAGVYSRHDWPCRGDAWGYYAREHHFGRFFEAKVAAGVAEFSDRLDKPCNQIWLAVMNGRIVGSVAIDGEDLAPGEAHLRWFILDDGCRGHGVGKNC